jgi:sugar-specific transcriptional regulator TrmB
MSSPRNDDTDALLAVGLTPDEVDAYEALLIKPGSTASDIVAVSGKSLRSVQRTLASLELQGLATRSPERHARYLPTPPDIAVEALIAKRTDELQRARIAALRLREKTSQAHLVHEDDRIVELVTGRDAQARVFEQLQRGAHRELLSIERPPYVIGANARNEAQEQAMSRGVSYRNIIEADALQMPGKFDHVQRQMNGGEQTRVFTGLPLKLIIVDRRIAIIPLDIARATRSALLVRPSSLLDALCELFEMLWSRATPLPMAGKRIRSDAAAAGDASDDGDALIALLAAGLKDKVIASQLGIAGRTLDRRLVDLFHALNARTRFQAGWVAALRSVGMLQ